MKFSSTVGLACLAPGPAGALVGFSYSPYDPTCAYACYRSLSSFMLSCSNVDYIGGHISHDMSGMYTSPYCRANNTAYLATNAWCLNTKCAQLSHVATSQIEAFWEAQITGDASVPAKWSYTAALLNITRPPTRELVEGDDLLVTALAPEASWEGELRTLASRTKPYIVYPSTIGTYHVRPLPYLIGNAPTIGQSLYVTLLLILNIILTAVNYKFAQPSLWYSTQYQEILAFVMYRTGVLAFCLAPLVILFAGRNNVLLWLSNWSHSTYMILHRWVARIFAIQVILHSIIALVLYKDTGAFATEQKKPYWIWGAVATVAVCIMLVASGLYMRRWSYETFLIMHVVLAIFVIVGCWYHVYLEFGTTWGYIEWIYAAVAVWFVDRLARVMRILKTGVRRAQVFEIGDGYVRVDIKGVRWDAEPGKHVYVYFPSLNPLRPWENHPFLVLPTAMLRVSSHGTSSESSSDLAAGLDNKDVEQNKGPNVANAAPNGFTTAGLTLFVKKSTGMTKSLKAHDGLVTLLDGPYPNNPTKPVLRCDRLLLIGGGIGVAALLPWLRVHSNAKLCWSVKESAECLVQAFDKVLSGDVEKHVRVGQRLDVHALLSEEVLAGWDKVGVVVCGPGGLCDDVRAAVAAAGKREKTVFELEVDAFTW